MNRPNKALKAGTNGDAKLALLANGASGGWEIAIDERMDGSARYYAQLEGPQTFFYFEVLSLQTIEAAAHFLQHGNALPEAPKGERSASLRLGSFGRAPVNLTWDEEYADRCFLIVGPSATASLRLSFGGEEVGHLTEALRQVVADLHEAGSR